MTRAREKLYLSCCRRRRIAGRYQDQSESPFLQELPDHLVEVKYSPELYYGNERPDARAQNVYSFFNQGRPTAPAGASNRPPAPSAPSSSSYGGSSYVRAPMAPKPAPGGRQVVPEPEAVVAPRRPLKRGSRVRHPTL